MYKRQIVYCPDSDYAANIELAEAVSLFARRADPAKALELSLIHI